MSATEEKKNTQKDFDEAVKAARQEGYDEGYTQGYEDGLEQA